MSRCLAVFIYRPRVVCEKSIVIAGRVDESSHQPPQAIASLAAGQGYSQQEGGDLDDYYVISLDFHNLIYPNVWISAVEGGGKGVASIYFHHNYGLWQETRH